MNQDFKFRCIVGTDYYVTNEHLLRADGFSVLGWLEAIGMVFVLVGLSVGVLFQSGNSSFLAEEDSFRPA